MSSMKRRALLIAGGAWLATAATRSLAQTSSTPHRIAVLLPGTESGYRSRFAGFRAELKRLGQVEGRDFLFEVRYADDRVESLPALAAELVMLSPAVILTNSAAGIAACMKATSTVPIVFATGGQVVDRGFVASLRRPGGNVTGITTRSELTGKIVEIAREAFPRAKRFAILVHEPDPVHTVMVELFLDAGKKLQLDAAVIRVARREDLDRAFRELAARKTDVLLLPSLSFNASNFGEIAERSQRARVPMASAYTEETAKGGVLGYGTRREENFRRAAALVDKILRGAKPGDLAVEQPEKIELVVNLKTATAIGVTVSPAVLLRADRVIE